MCCRSMAIFSPFVHGKLGAYGHALRVFRIWFSSRLEFQLLSQYSWSTLLALDKTQNLPQLTLFDFLQLLTIFSLIFHFQHLALWLQVPSPLCCLACHFSQACATPRRLLTRAAMSFTWVPGQASAATLSAIWVFYKLLLDLYLSPLPSIPPTLTSPLLLLHLLHPPRLPLHATPTSFSHLGCSPPCVDHFPSLGILFSHLFLSFWCGIMQIVVESCRSFFYMLD